VSARRPSWIYARGDDPDYRFSLANERTFLAWMRTSLGLVAGAVALELLPVEQEVGPLVALLLGLGSATVLVGWVRWAMSERAMRRREALPSLAPLGVVALAVAVVPAVLLWQS
jgi:putative membrane protein